ncbi:asparaginase [Peribacillus muralis]|uniref:asparaginase n=1 Tax=Peribacillus muralis TaxID=264697 RepID=UPI00070F9F0C|nr:asparaginase [Peribacillus muralis]
MKKEKLPRITILAVGGTIAGKGANITQTTQYEAGVLTIESLIDAVPDVYSLAEVNGYQIANIPSFAITDEVWLQLARKVNELLWQPHCDGVVITHGTDTLEETAYFLHLTVKSEKPVVMVGALRPATSLSADGPLNLYNGVALAASNIARGHGVLISLNGRIGSARDTSKLHTTATDAFASPEAGLLGYMLDNKPHFYYKSLRRHTVDSEFDVTGISQLPRVDILYAHSQDTRDLIDAAVNAGTAGVVHAGTGNGGIFPLTRQGLQDASKQGVVIVSTSRIGNGMVTTKPIDMKSHFLASDNLNPQKARVLLQLALTKTNQTTEIQRMFQIY